MNFIKATNEMCSLAHHLPAPIIRKAFLLDFKPQSARITVCVSGFYELYLNEKQITKGLLSPYITNPSHIVYSDEYDISELLCEGRNAVSLILGNGFANQDVSSWEFSSAPFRAPLCAAIELTAEAGEDRFFLESDESFKVHSSAIRFDMYRYGVIYDAREESEGFAAADFDDEAWDNAIIADAPLGDVIPSRSVPIKPQYELSPIHIEKQTDFCYLNDNDGMPLSRTHVNEGWLYDFGKNCAGVCRLKIKGTRGQKITLRHAESLRGGKFNMNSILTLSPEYDRFIDYYQTDVYYLKGCEEEIFTPTFTYHGFRYVLVEGITDEQATEDLLTYVVFNTDIKKRANFSSSDSILNTLYEMGIRSDLSNFHHFPTDCPHREKNGWTGDISVSAHQLLLNFKASDSFDMWLESVRYAQLPSGKLPGIVPTATWGYDWGSGPVWDSVIVNLPYYCYKYDGRADIIEKNADMIVRYLKYIASRRDERGLIACGLGDWVEPRKRGAPISAPLALTDSIQILEAAEKSAFLLNIIGRRSDAEYAAELSRSMREAIRAHLIDIPSRTAAGRCQTSQALALRFSVFNESERADAYARLIELIEEKNGHAATGMIGLRYIFHVLFDEGDADLALNMIKRPDAPSYGNMIALGGTALFEATEQNGIQESQNHHFYGDILHLFISKLAGIRVNPDMNDKNTVLIKPTVPETIDRAEASYEFDSGKLLVKWEKVDGRVILTVTAPLGIQGKIDILGEKHELECGRTAVYYAPLINR